MRLDKDSKPCVLTLSGNSITEIPLKLCLFFWLLCFVFSPFHWFLAQSFLPLVKIPMMYPVLHVKIDVLTLIPN